MTDYATSADLPDYLLQTYIDKAEEFNPGIVARSLEAVSREAGEAMTIAGYQLPSGETVPATLRRIVATIAAYRVLGAITSLVADEGGSDNEFLVVQRIAAQSTRDLLAIREGRFNLGLPLAEAEEVGAVAASAVIAPKPLFDSLDELF